MNTIKQRLLTDWNFARFLRLALGMWMLAWAIQTGEWAAAVFGGLFLFMALSNTGCCGSQTCSLPNSQTGDKNQVKKLINNE